MKKIFLGILVAGAVGGVAMLATNAFFSDTETSKGNSFTAGQLDLRFQVEGAQTENWTDVNGNPLFGGVTLPLTDLKPGDKGEKTVKLWVDNNPSCGQVSINVTEDQDNSCTGPELINDPNCAGSANGELNDQVNFAVWKDPNCNNILDQSETLLVSGPITSDKAYNIGDLPVGVNAAQCYGIAYCFGTWNGTACDGSLVNNAAQSDSFKADLIINALQKRNQFPNGCPTGEIKTVNLENKDTSWQIMSNDTIFGTMTYSSGWKRFYGTVKVQGLQPISKYQITLNGPGVCQATDTQLATAVVSDLFESGYWNNYGQNDLAPTCAAALGQGIYNMNLISDWYTFISDSNGSFVYPFDLALQQGSYTGVKVLVKKMSDTFASPWVDSNYEHINNLFEVAPISFTVLQ